MHYTALLKCSPVQIDEQSYKLSLVKKLNVFLHIQWKFNYCMVQTNLLVTSDQDVQDPVYHEYNCAHQTESNSILLCESTTLCLGKFLVFC